MESADRLLSMDLRAGDADWSPTPHGHWLARMIAENDLVKDRDVLELGAGVANHTILIHRKGAKSIVATPRPRTSPAADGGSGAASAASARACACRDRRTSCRAACCARRSVSAATATAADADADVEMPTDDEVDIKIVR